MKLCLMALVLMHSLTAFAQRASGTEGHGGDDVGLDFQRAMISGLYELKKYDAELFVKVPFQELKDLAVSAALIVEDGPLFVTVRGAKQESVAINFAEEGVVHIDRNRWKKISEPRLKQAIGVHELLSLKKIESTGYYPHSGPFLAAQGIRAESIVSGEIAEDRQSSSPAGARYETTKCNEMTVVIERSTGRKIVDEAEKTQGLVAWSQDGEQFELSFGGIEHDVVTNRSFVMTTRSKTEKDSLGRGTRLIGQRLLQVLTDGKVTRLEGSVELISERLSENESEVSTWMAGKRSPQTTRTLTRRLADGQQLQVIETRNFDQPGAAFIVESQVRTCTSRPRRFEELDSVFPSTVARAIREFESAIESVAAAGVAGDDRQALEARRKRDALWANVYDLRALIPAKKTVAKKSPSKRVLERGEVRPSPSPRLTEEARRNMDETFQTLRDMGQRPYARMGVRHGHGRWRRW